MHPNSGLAEMPGTCGTQLTADPRNPHQYYSSLKIKTCVNKTSTFF